MKNKAPFKSHAGMTMVVDEDSCGEYGEKYAEWLQKTYPSLTVDFIERQSGGSGLFDKNWHDTEIGNWYWEKFCNQS